MNRAIRRVGIAVTALILILVAQLTYFQVIDANSLKNDPRNVRTTLDQYNRARGDILTAEGDVVARSVPTGTKFTLFGSSPAAVMIASTCGRTPLGSAIVLPGKSLSVAIGFDDRLMMAPGAFCMIAANALTGMPLTRARMVPLTSPSVVSA